MDKSTEEHTSTKTIVILFFCLLGLIVLLVFLYKKLNREADGEYTIQNIVYKEGGIRDQVRRGVLALGTRLGVRLWPGSDTNEDGEEMQEVRDEEEQVEESNSQRNDSEGDDQDEEDNIVGQGEKEDDTSNDPSSLKSSEAGEKTRLMDQREAKDETIGKMREKEEKIGEGKGKEGTSGGAGFLIDLKQFSGSANWSEEEVGEDKDRDVTAL